MSAEHIASSTPAEASTSHSPAESLRELSQDEDRPPPSMTASELSEDLTMQSCPAGRHLFSRRSSSSEHLVGSSSGVSDRDEFPDQQQSASLVVDPEHAGPLLGGGSPTPTAGAPSSEGGPRPQQQVSFGSTSDNSASSIPTLVPRQASSGGRSVSAASERPSTMTTPQEVNPKKKLFDELQRFGVSSFNLSRFDPSNGHTFIPCWKGHVGKEFDPDLRRAWREGKVPVSDLSEESLDRQNGP